MKKHQSQQNSVLQNPDQRKPQISGPLATTVRNPGPVANGGSAPLSMTTVSLTRDSNVQQENPLSEFRFLGFVFSRLNSRNVTFISNAQSLKYNAIDIQIFRYFGLDIVSYFHDLGDHGDIDD